MKRKLNEVDIPTAVDLNGSAVAGLSKPSSATPNFNTMGLDSRLIQAIVRENFSNPTDIQAKSIPLTLEGKDILARSKTGSGKTAAYVLPILHSILQRKLKGSTGKTTTALILVPTRELAQQVSKVVSTFSVFCSKDVRCINLTQKIPETVQRTLLAESPDIVVATPARAAQNVQNSALSVDNLVHLVIDEADLVLSYGYDDDLQLLSRAIPGGIQKSLMSATMTSEVDSLKGLFCKDPIILDLTEKAEDAGGVSQYVVECAEDEKFLLAYVIFKLKLIHGKCIIFVSDIDRCYRLKLFFEQFGIRSCVLNSELPVNSRIHVVEEFNKNVYEIIIASDEHEVLDCHTTKDSIDVQNDLEESDIANRFTSVEDNPDWQSVQGNNRSQKAATSGHNGKQAVSQKTDQEKPKKRKEYGVSRGIDFQNVSCVLNFDLPVSSKSYIHRIGRTARAGKTGMALSFVVPADHYHKHKSLTVALSKHDMETLEKITKQQQKKGKELMPYHFDMKQVEAFRYRMNDALRAVTRLAIREARTRELRQELLQSEKLKRHFEENPDDLHHLRHDGESRAARIQPHLKHVPDYLMPSNGKNGIAGEDIGFVGLRKTSDNRIRRARMQNRMKGKGKKLVGRKLDPLKTFNAKGRR